MSNRLPSATGTNQIVSGPGSRSAAWLARSVWLVSVAFLVVFLGYGLVSPANAARTGTLANAVAFLAFVLAFSTLGGLVASKRPGHPIGWLLLASALCYSVGGLSVSLPQPTGGGLSPALFAQWAGTWAWGVGVGLAVVVLLLFPDGRLPSRRWRPVLWLAIGVMLAIVLGVGFGSPFIGDSRVPNPFALGGSVGEVLRALDAAFPLLLLVALLAVVSVIVRWRRAREIERQQIKWLLYPALLVGLGLVAQVPLLTLTGSSEAVTDASNAILTGTFASLPVGIGIAVLRYRLYDIDRIISRTLAYAVVTVILGAVFVATILVLQELLAPVTSGTPIAVAVSTLFVASLFQPVRRRIQNVVDRRFNRARYDAEREVERFAAQIRDEVEVERVTAALTATLQRTTQPATAVVWLREVAR